MLKDNSLLDPNNQSRKDMSSTWSGIIFGANLMRQGLVSRIGDGTNQILDRQLVGLGALIGETPGNLHVDNNLTVSIFLLDDRWDVQRLHSLLPKLIWGHSCKSVLSVKSAYGLFFHFEGYKDLRGRS